MTTLGRLSNIGDEIICPRDIPTSDMLYGLSIILLQSLQIYFYRKLFWETSGNFFSFRDIKEGVYEGLGLNQTVVKGL